MRILILAAGGAFSSTSIAATVNNPYPLMLTEIQGIPLLQRIISSCNELDGATLAITLNDEDIRKYHIDTIASLLSPGITVFNVFNKTKGAACSALLAKDFIDVDDDLLIINSNELINVNYAEVINDFKIRKLDAGVITFSSIHPRYSFVQLNHEGYVVEAAEKNPISQNATAGFYWFLKGRSFVSAAENMIRKDSNTNGLYYICPTLNEMVLDKSIIGVYTIDSSQYHTLKNEHDQNYFIKSFDK